MIRIVLTLTILVNFCLFKTTAVIFKAENIKNFEDGIIFFHLGKTGGTFIRVNLCDFFKFDGYGKTFEPHGTETRSTLDAIKLYTENDIVSSGHVYLNDLIVHKKRNRPIIVYLRNPVQRTISFYRYAKHMVSYTDNIEMKQELPDFHLMNLNSLDQVQTSFRFNELARFSPKGEFFPIDDISSEILDECVRFTLENCAFVGDFDHMEDSLNKLNLYLGLSLDVESIVNVKIYETPNTIEKITNPEVISFLTEKLKWEFMFNERVFAAQRWKYGTPILKKPGERRASMTQYIMPEGFDPDQYLIDQGIKDEIEAKVGQDKWKKREAAIVHFIEDSREKSRL